MKTPRTPTMPRPEMPSDTEMLDWLADQCDVTLHELIDEWDCEDFREFIAAAMREEQG